MSNMNKGTVNFINKKANIRVQKALENADKLNNQTQYEAMKNNLTKLLSDIGMTVKVHLYGSRIIGLANDESDLDIYIEYGNNFYNDKDVNRDRAILERVVDGLQNGGLWSIKSKILTASVPILEIIYIPTNLKCDISVSNGLGVRNSLIIRYLFDLQSGARTFYLFMKIFLKRYERCFEGYLLKLLVIFFFQNENIFPSIKLVQEGIQPVMINGWQVQFDPQRTIKYYNLQEMGKYKSYIPKFFTFYSTFNYKRDVISIYDGKAIKRENYEYKDEIEEHEMCVFGPINRKNNIGKYPSKRDFDYFKLLSTSLASEFTKKYAFNT